MVESLLSQSWYRVAELKPRLRSHARIHRHQFRGETWYILQDQSSERFHRFSPPAYKIIGLMDGVRTVEDIWNIVLTQFGDDAPTQDEVIQLLGQLHGADVLQCDVPPDTQEIFRRRTRAAKSRLRKKLLSIFAWQIPLFDPEKFLNATLPLVRPLVGWVGLLAWIGAVTAAVVLGSAHWSEFTENVFDRMLAPGNLVMLWLLFPLVKLLHELGHAFAVKIYGGEVHEMGLMLLVFSPTPYVDASAAWGFRSKWQRIVVGSAGMAVEVFIASIAMLVWLAVEPGVARSLCYNTILIAGISTVLFNANPLLRFDGYYMLMDYLEIPNLNTRATKYLTYLCERYVFGRKEAKLQTAGRGERAWFVGYAFASFFYRLTVIAAILFFVGQQHLLLGLIFAGTTAFAWLVLPGWRIGKYLATNPGIHKVRKRAVMSTATFVGGVVLILLALPMPFRTVIEGVVWVRDEGIVRAGADGFVRRVVARPGAMVEIGQVLIECDDPDLLTEAQVFEAQ
ncbi:MAG: PqqD family peptide modification chaperone, partial [Burkholderiales bacterium]